MATYNNFNTFAQRLQAVAQQAVKETKELVEYHTGEIELEAIRNAPGGGDLIRTQGGTETQADIARGRNWVSVSQAIGYNLTNNGLTGTVFVEKSAGPIAIWVEMGTGQSAASYLLTVPAEWRALAQRYYINGRGTILNQPYMLPAFLRQGIEFKKDIKDLLNNITL